MSLSTEAELMSNFGCLWTAEARTKDEVALQWSCSPNITRNWDPPFVGLSTVPKSQGDPKIVKRGPNGDPVLSKKGTKWGPF